MKKINDVVLIEMINRGDQQNTMARFFGVSPAAISKKLKCIRKQEAQVAVFSGLTEKERLFVAARAGGDNQTKAATIAYDCGTVESAKSIGSRLAHDPRIQGAIATVMNEEGLDRRHLVRRLRAHVNGSDSNVSLKAVDMGLKLHDAYPATKSVNLHANVEFIPIDLSLYE